MQSKEIAILLVGVSATILFAVFPPRGAKMKLLLGILAISCLIYSGMTIILLGIGTMKIPFLPVVIAGGIIGAILSGLAWKNVQARASGTEDKHFFVSLVNSIIGGPYYAYKSANENLYAIDVLICIDLVNKANVFSKVNDYYGQLLLDDEWVALRRVPFYENGQFYFGVQNINKSRSIEFNQKTLDEQIGYSNIKPGETISGILMFYFKDSDRKKYSPIKARAIKLVIFDSMKNKEEHLIDLGSNEKDKKDDFGMGWTGAFGFKIKEPEVDLRKYRILNYQQPSHESKPKTP